VQVSLVPGGHAAMQHKTLRPEMFYCSCNTLLAPGEEVFNRSIYTDIKLHSLFNNVCQLFTICNTHPVYTSYLAVI